MVAMPGEPAVTAAWKADSMVGTVGWVDRAPVQAGVGRPSSAAQSWNPYWVGVKKELSVTWLTKVNFHLGVVGKLPAAPSPPPTTTSTTSGRRCWNSMSCTPR